MLSALLVAATDAAEQAMRIRERGDDTFADLDGTSAAADFKRDSRIKELKKRVSVGVRIYTSLYLRICWHT